MSERRVTPYWEAVEEGQEYKWCACGRSATQPWCDGSHEGTGIEPVVFRKGAVDHVMLCGCKATKNPPYCDGAHRDLMAPDEAEREERFPTGTPARDQHSTSTPIGAAVPDLPVSDCPASIRYYCDVLGFEKVFDDAALGFDRTLYACVQRGKLTLTLDWHRSDDLAHKVLLNTTVGDVDALHAEFVARGATIVKPLTNFVWGERSFTVADPDGHQLSFSMPIDPDEFQPDDSDA